MYFCARPALPGSDNIPDPTQLLCIMWQQLSDLCTLLISSAPGITGEPLEPSAELLEKNFHVWPVTLSRLAATYNDKSRGLKYVYRIKSMSFLHRAYQPSSCQHWRAIAVISIASREDQRAFPGHFSVYRDPSNRY